MYAATQLHRLAAFGTPDEVRKYLEYYPGDAFVSDYKGFVPLHHAALR